MIIFTRILLVVIAVTTVFSANAEARFPSPDPVRVVDQNGKINQVILANPQRLNQYVYGLNNPYRYVDPDGEFAFAATPLFAAGAWALDAMMPKSTDVSNSMGALDYIDGGVSFLPMGAAGLGVVKGASKLIKIGQTSKRNVKHISHHLKDFQKLDPKMDFKSVESLGKKIAGNMDNYVGGKGGNMNFEKIVSLGGKQVPVRAALNKNKTLRTVHLRNKKTHD